MKVSDVLTGPDRWFQGWYAVTEDGTPVSPASQHACRWCLVGAIKLCYPVWEDEEKAYDAVLRVTGAKSVHVWNDAHGRTWEEVREAIEKAGV